jgi:ABC-type transporter Mla MlaB component
MEGGTEHLTVGRREEKTFIHLKGEATVAFRGLLRDALLEALRDSRSCELVLEGAERIDASVLELLCSARRFALGMGKDVAVSAEPPGALAEAAVRTGFLRRRGCTAYCGERCLWVAEDGEERGTP